MKAETNSVFQTLNSINVNDRVEKKDTGSAKLTYLSWPWAWSEVMKQYPDAEYSIYKDEQHRPYIEDNNLGYMVSTSITINGQTREMWLPVMDSSNKSMKSAPYTYNVWNRNQNKWIEKRVEAASMFDINKAIMRCLVKNLAMFGLGLYIYAGEDIPEDEESQPAPQPTAKPTPQPAAPATAPAPATKPATGNPHFDTPDPTSLAAQHENEWIEKANKCENIQKLQALYESAPSGFKSKESNFYHAVTNRALALQTA